MRYLSLFSGIEACTMAWHRIGWEPVAFCEFDAFPSAVLAHHYPDVPNLGDITKVTDDDIRALGRIDLVVGGSPCQDLSVAGKRAGLSGKRSSLFHHQMRIFHAARHFCGARWLLWENVPGAFSSSAGRDFAAVVGAMAGCQFGVPPRDRWQNAGVCAGPNGLVEWRTLDAQYVRVESHPRAVPQRRRRVFALLDTGDWPNRPPVLLEPEGLRGDSAPCREVRETAPTIPARSLGGGGLGTDFDCDGGIVTSHDVAHPLLAKDNSSHRSDAESYVADTLKAEGFAASEDGRGRGTPLVPVMSSGQANAEICDNLSPSLNCNRDGAPIVAFDCKGTEVQHSENVNPPLRSMCHNGSHANAGGHAAIAIQERAVSDIPSSGPGGAGFRTDGAAYTLEARNVSQAVAFDTTQITSKENRSNPKEGDPSHPLCAGANPPAIVNNMSVRRLTTRECERLQGFPDDFTRIPYRGKPADKCADSPRYKALGNSMAVNVMSWIGQRIEAATNE